LEGELALSVLEVFGRNWVVEAFFLCAIIRKTTIMHPLPPLPIFKASSLASILKLPDYYNLQTGVYYRNPSSVDSFSKLHHSREESAEKVKYSQGLHWRRRRMMKKVVICQAALTHTGVVDNNGKTTPNSGHPFVQVCNVLSVSANLPCILFSLSFHDEDGYLQSFLWYTFKALSVCILSAISFGFLPVISFSFSLQSHSIFSLQLHPSAKCFEVFSTNK
jgi:hypothetical protein